MTGLFETYRANCTGRLLGAVERRPGNALNVEVGASADRCMDKRPKTWPDNVSSARWLASGGGQLIFGACCPVCPRLCSHGEGESCWWCSTEDDSE